MVILECLNRANANGSDGFPIWEATCFSDTNRRQPMLLDAADHLCNLVPRTTGRAFGCVRSASSLTNGINSVMLASRRPKLLWERAPNMDTWWAADLKTLLCQSGLPDLTGLPQPVAQAPEHDRSLLVRRRHQHHSSRVRS
jgi:hypothetical protein